MSDSWLQDAYNQEVRACDIFLSLFKTKTGKDPCLDFFNTPYEGDIVDNVYILRSCGRDLYCYTEDDLIVSIIRSE